MAEPTPGQNGSVYTAGFQINIVNSQIKDTVGAGLLALIAVLLVFALLRSQRRNRKLLERLQSMNP